MAKDRSEDQPQTTRSARPTLRDAIAALAKDRTLTAARRAIYRDALKRLAKLYGKKPEDMVASPVWLHDRWRGIAEPGSRPTKRVLKQVRRNALLALRHVGLSRPRGDPKTALSPAWHALWLKLEPGMMRSRVVKLFRYCSARQIDPNALDDSHVAAFHRELDPKDASQQCRADLRLTINTWNQARTRFPDWPRIELAQLPSRRRRATITLEELPDSFRRDVAKWEAWAGNTDPFAEGAIDKPLRPLTIMTAKKRYRRLASALIKRGHRAADIIDLAYLVKPNHLREALQVLHEQLGSQSGYLQGIVASMQAVAAAYVKSSDADLAAIAVLRRRVKVGHRGMSHANRVRLRGLDDEAAKLKLVNLPRSMVRRIEAAGRPNPALAREFQIAVAIEILLFAPIRLRNLAALEIERHLIWSRAGRRGTVSIMVDQAEVKNRVAIEHQLPEESSALVAAYLRDWRPLLTYAKASNKYLFPGLRAEPKHPQHLSRQIGDRVFGETGVRLTAGLFRHGAAKLFLDERPGQLEVVRRVLGHRQSSVALDNYIGASDRAAVKHYDEQILKLRDRAGKPET